MSSKLIHSEDTTPKKTDIPMMMEMRHPIGGDETIRCGAHPQSLQTCQPNIDVEFLDSIIP